MNDNRVIHSKHHEFDTEALMDALESRQEKKLNLSVKMENTVMAEDGNTILCKPERLNQKAFQMNETALKQTLAVYEEKKEKELPVETFLNVLDAKERQSVWNREIRSIPGTRVFRIHAPINKETGRIDYNGLSAAYANVSTKYKPLDNNVVSAIIRQSEKRIVMVSGSVIDTDHSKFRFIPANSDGIDVGEFTPGFEVTNSESGMGALEFYAFVYRKVCSNGMMIRVEGAGMNFRQIHIGNGASINVPDMSKLWDRAVEMANMHNHAASVVVPMEHKIHVINRAKDAGLLNEQIDTVIDTANEFYHGGNTVANIVGSITHAAQRYRKDDTKKRTEMELFAGNTLEYLMGKAA